MSVVNNTQTLESQLTKKSNSICYHGVRELVTMNENQTGHIASTENLGRPCHKMYWWSAEADPFGQQGAL